MFFNLAWRNSKRNRSENLIYFLTMVTAVATFYIVLSLGSQDVMRFLEEIESDAVNRLLTMLMPTVYLFSLLFVFFLVIFANKYQLECRSRELGLYLMFGMTKRHLFIQIMAEGLITSLLALLGGLICGGFLSEVISLATARLVGRGIIAHQSNSQEEIARFKKMENAVLFAAGSCWEGVDFPGDMVSSLIIVKLPFSVPDPIHEAQKEQYRSLESYIQTIVVPDMQKKLRQGFGRAIRTEQDTCVVSILDHRTAKKGRYRSDVLEALPKCQMAERIEEVENFIRSRKVERYYS